MQQAAPTTRPPGSAAALAREALQQASADEREEMLPAAQPPGSAAALLAKYCSRLHHPRRRRRRRGTCSRSPARRRARRRSQRCRRSSNTGNHPRSSTSKMMMRTTRITSVAAAAAASLAATSRTTSSRGSGSSGSASCTSCWASRSFGCSSSRLLFSRVRRPWCVTGLTFESLGAVPGVRPLRADRPARAARRARELNATLPKAALAKVLDVVASCWVWAALVPAFVRTYIAAVAHDQSAWMVALLCAVSFVTDVSGVCVTWVAVTPLCRGDRCPSPRARRPYGARKKKMTARTSSWRSAASWARVWLEGGWARGRKLTCAAAFLRAIGSNASWLSTHWKARVRRARGPTLPERRQPARAPRVVARPAVAPAHGRVPLLGC